MRYELEMIKLYDYLQKPSTYKAVKNKEKGIPLLPLRCIFVNVDIEISIDTKGNFLGASVVPKEDSPTIVPATEDSACRCSNASPHLAFDNLKYVAGDLLTYFSPSSKKEENDKAEKIKEKHQKYLELLQKTSSCEKAPEALKAIYQYAKKDTLITDLLSTGDINIRNVLANEKKNKQNHDSVFLFQNPDAKIRFRVEGAPIPECWNDPQLVRFWQEFCRREEDVIQIKKKNKVHSISGEEQTICTTFPRGVLGNADACKPYSSNASESYDYTFKGRFDKAESINRLGLDDAWKIFAAMRYLYDTSCRNLNGYYLMTWSSNPELTGQIYANSSKVIGGKQPSKDIIIDAKSSKADSTIWKKCIAQRGLKHAEEKVAGYEKRINDFLELLDGKKHSFDQYKDEQVILMGILKSMPGEKKGRFSVVDCQVLNGSKYEENLTKWFSEGARTQITPVKGGYEEYFGIPSIDDMALLFFGREDNNNYLRMNTDNEKADANVSKFYQIMIKCMVSGKKIPPAYVQKISKKALRPFVFKRKGNYQRTLDLACTLISKERNMNDMGKLDETCTDRSYLFGRLVAVAQKAEFKTYDDEDRVKRITNAEKMLEKVYQHPASRWKELYLRRLQPYLRKMEFKDRRFFTKLIDSITEKIALEDMNDKTCNGLFLMGYSSQMTDLMYQKKEQGEKQEAADTEN